MNKQAQRKAGAIRIATREKKRRLRAMTQFCRHWSGMSFMLFTLVAGIYLPTMVENDAGLAVPLEHYRKELRDTISTSQLSASIQPVKQNIYLFALDCSSSVDSHLPEIPKWFDRVYQGLADSSDPVSEIEKPHAYDVTKFAFYYLLSNLVEGTVQPESVTNEDSSQFDQFALWDVCGGGAKFFPKLNRTMPVSYRNAVEATQELEGRTFTDEPKTTEFLELFRQLDRTYQISGQSYGGKNREKMFIITIVSDFLDSPGKAAKGAPKTSERDEEWLIEKRRHEIEKATQTLLSGRVVVNVIMAGRHVAGEGGIVSYMRDSVDWYKFNEISIVDDLIGAKDKMLYPVYKVSRPMRIYFERRSRVEGKIALKVDQPGMVALSLAAHTQQPLDNFALEYGYRGGVDVGENEIRGRLAGGQSVRFENLPGNTSIILKYDGSVPMQSQTLKISVGSQRRTYLVPIRFQPRLPARVADLLIGLGLLIGALLLAWASPYAWGFLSGMTFPSRYSPNE